MFKGSNCNNQGGVNIKDIFKKYFELGAIFISA